MHLGPQVDLETPHPAGCHDQRIVQGAQTSAKAAHLVGAAIGTSAEGICTKREGTASKGGSPQRAVAIILPQGGQGEVLVTSSLPEEKLTWILTRGGQ